MYDVFRFLHFNFFNMTEVQLSETKTRMVDIPGAVMNQRLVLADKLFKAKCFGSDVKNAEQAFVKIMAGAEMGMGAMESMNSLYIVNGKITIWGSALSRKIKEAGWKITYEEEGVESCKATIKKGDDVYSYEATKADMIALNSQAYKKSPKDKLKWHALSRLVRFYVPEIMGGSVSYTQEEYEDVKPRKKMVVEESKPEKKIPTAEELIKGLQKASKETLEKTRHDLPKFMDNYETEELDAISDAIKEREAMLSAPEAELPLTAKENDSN